MLKKLNIFKIVIIVLSFLALIGLFLPYESSYGYFRKYLKEKPNEIYLKEVNYKNSDVIDISIVENLKVYNYTLINEKDNNWLFGVSLTNVILTVVLIISIILTMVFTIFNKKVLTIIFDVLMGISSLLMNKDIVSRGVIPSFNYTYGISYYLYPILAGLIIAITIVSIVKAKKNNKKIEQ